MNRDRIIHATTVVAVVSMMLLLYWVFAVGCVLVFGLKVFRENITQAFAFSVLGILALLAGSLIVNMVFNLSKIADTLAQGPAGAGERSPAKFPTAGHIGLLLLAFPLIAAGLFIGDRATTRNRERYLTESAQAVLRQHPKEVAGLLDYAFTKDYIAKTGQTLAILSRTNESAPQVRVIVEDRSAEPPLILSFGSYSTWETSKDRKRLDFLYPCSTEEQDYLKRVFSGQERKQWFSASDGSYEFYLPVSEGGRTIVIYFSDRREYGKLGS
ncbi:MAG: hypothetical protein HY924_11535 [Elusimicrobia bacterium]|nr:hypothetical protein [Elusimicrobiota bacterium]